MSIAIDKEFRVLITQAPVREPTPVATREDDELLAQGWDDHGLFKNDPEALKLFDEIEEKRDRLLVGDE
jgi:hypothetical protein